MIAELKALGEQHGTPSGIKHCLRIKIAMNNTLKIPTGLPSLKNGVRVTPGTR